MEDQQVEELKQRTREIWGLGDYVKLAARLEPAAQELLDACAISAGQEVLDVAAGNGNLAVLAAREGAAVVASDIAPSQVELGRMRTETEGLDVEWHEADAEALPFEDARFDCAASVFGAMFAPQPEVAARELFRVVRPGNTVGMANWPPDGFQGEYFGLLARYAPPPPEGFARPTDWGVEEVVRERFEGLAGSIELSRRTLLWEFGSAHEMWMFFSETGGNVPALRRSLSEERHAELGAEFEALVHEYNTASDGVAVPAEYVLVVARRRG